MVAGGVAVGELAGVVDRHPRLLAVRGVARDGDGALDVVLGRGRAVLLLDVVGLGLVPVGEELGRGGGEGLVPLDGGGGCAVGPLGVLVALGRLDLGQGAAQGLAVPHREVGLGGGVLQRGAGAQDERHPVVAVGDGAALVDAVDVPAHGDDELDGLLGAVGVGHLDGDRDGLGTGLADPGRGREGDDAPVGDGGAAPGGVEGADGERAGVRQGDVREVDRPAVLAEGRRAGGDLLAGRGLNAVVGGRVVVGVRRDHVIFDVHIKGAVVNGHRNGSRNIGGHSRCVRRGLPFVRSVLRKVGIVLDGILG